MSAFVVDQENMERVVDAICYRRPRLGALIYKFDGLDTQAPGARTEISRRLFSLNIEAIQQRYPDTLDNPDHMPGPCDTEGKSLALALRDSFKASDTPRSPCNLYQWVKSLKCLAYQCSEGDVTEKPLFRELEAAILSVAMCIVELNPAYEKASWG